MFSTKAPPNKAMRPEYKTNIESTIEIDYLRNHGQEYFTGGLPAIGQSRAAHTQGL